MTTMSDSYGLFWNSVSGDRVYNAGSFENWLKRFFATGVFKDDLIVSPLSGMSVNVSAGYCNINGIGYFPESAVFTLDVARGLPRIDTIVVERNDGARTFALRKITGTSSPTPIATPPVRTGGIYQLVLAQIYVEARKTEIISTDITDTRPDKDLCGLVSGVLDGLSKVAKTGKYDDLDKMPMLANVANTGDYYDLSGLPVFSNVALSGKYEDLTETPILSNVAYSGEYSDLTDLPSSGVNGIRANASGVLVREKETPGLAWMHNAVIIGTGLVGPDDHGLFPDSALSNGVAIGICARANSRGNIAIGYGSNAMSSTEAIAIGSGADASGGTADGIAIGMNARSISTGIALGANSVSEWSDTYLTKHHGMVLGNSELEELKSAVSLTVTSDRRDKADIKPIRKGLDLVKKLNPVTFCKNSRDLYLYGEDNLSEEELEIRRKYGLYKYDREAHEKGEKKNGKRRCGLLAQEVYDAMAEVYGDGGFGAVVNDNFHDLKEPPPDGVENQLSIAYLNLVPFLVEAVQDLSERFKRLEVEA